MLEGLCNDRLRRKLLNWSRTPPDFLVVYGHLLTLLRVIIFLILLWLRFASDLLKTVMMMMKYYMDNGQSSSEQRKHTD